MAENKIWISTPTWMEMSKVYSRSFDSNGLPIGTNLTIFEQNLEAI
jgi:hypothetical protein